MFQVLLTGADGQLGREIRQLASHFPDFQISATTREELDITDASAVETYFRNHRPDFCINAAAYTAVDRAESEEQQARSVNVNGVRLMAVACRNANVPLLHYSTDYVYHTNNNRPYREEDITTPRGIYAETKLEGEDMARNQHEKTIILRTSWVYSPYGKNFLNTMLRLGRERDHLRIVFDQIGTPTYARDLARCSLHILQTLQKNRSAPSRYYGVFNYSNEGVCSWYDFALAIFEMAGIECTVDPIESKEYPTPAQRPHFSVLNKQRVKETFGLKIPHWRERLRACLERMQD